MAGKNYNDKKKKVKNKKSMCLQGMHQWGAEQIKNENVEQKNIWLEDIQQQEQRKVLLEVNWQQESEGIKSKSEEYRTEDYQTC